MAKRNPARESRYKKYKNKLTHLIKGAIKAYYEKRFDAVNSFCIFFANIGPELASKIPHHNVSFLSFLDLSYSESMFLCPTNKNELQDICYSFKTGKAPGFDNVSMYLSLFLFNPLLILYICLYAWECFLKN